MRAADLSTTSLYNHAMLANGLADRRSAQTYEDIQKSNIVDYFRFVDSVLAFRTLVIIWHYSQGSSERSERSVRFNPNLRSERVRYFFRT